MGQSMSDPNLNPYAPPVASLVPETEAQGPTDGVWRDGGLLVVRKGSVLPARCVKCNEPVEGKRKRQTLYWCSPWVYLLVISPLILVIVYMIIRQSIVVQTAVCRQHRSQRNRVILVAWLLVFGGVGLIILGGTMMDNHRPNDLGLPLILAGCVLVVAGPIYGVTAARLQWAKRIDSYFAWLKGASPDYLAELPELPPPSYPPYQPR